MFPFYLSTKEHEYPKAPVRRFFDENCTGQGQRVGQCNDAVL